MQSWYRDTSKVFDFIAITQVQRCYTDVEEAIKTYQEEIDYFVQKRCLLLLEKNSYDWVKEVVGEFDGISKSLQKKVEAYESKRLRKEELKNKRKSQYLNQLLADKMNFNN